MQYVKAAKFYKTAFIFGTIDSIQRMLIKTLKISNPRRKFVPTQRDS